jgi:hypothetical protein
VCDICKPAAGTSGRTCCRLSPRTPCKRVVVNNLRRMSYIHVKQAEGIGCSLLSGQLEDIQDGPVSQGSGFKIKYLSAMVSKQ